MRTVRVPLIALPGGTGRGFFAHGGANGWFWQVGIEFTPWVLPTNPTGGTVSLQAPANVLQS